MFHRQGFNAQKTVILRSTETKARRLLTLGLYGKKASKATQLLNGSIKGATMKIYIAGAISNNPDYEKQFNYRGYPTTQTTRYNQLHHLRKQRNSAKHLLLELLNQRPTPEREHTHRQSNERLHHTTTRPTIQKQKSLAASTHLPQNTPKQHHTHLLHTTCTRQRKPLTHHR